MISVDYVLHPFDNDGISSFAVAGTISRTAELLTLTYQISGKIKELKLNRAIAMATRSDRLWETTCFECFFRKEGVGEYREMNVSIDGCWNMYRFTDYRRGMVEETVLDTLTSETIKENGKVGLRCSFPLRGIVAPEEQLQVGVSCVLELKNGEKSYWALVHPGERPDFHHPDGLILQL